MSEKDFVMAWLLTARAGVGTGYWSIETVKNLMSNARDAFKEVERQYPNDTDE